MIALVVAIVLLLALCVVVAFAVREARSLHITRIDVSMQDWPEDAGEVRIAHLSDLHLPDAPVSRKQILAALEEIEPHMVVISGDILTWDADIDAAVHLIRCLAAHGPVLCVTGNVEHTFSLDIDAFGEAIEPIGGVLLSDELWNGMVSGARVSVLGLEHREDGPLDADVVLPEARDADLSIVVAHTPPKWVHVDRQRAHLFLCGHTHGGQLRVPVLGRFLAHSQMEWELKSGIFELPGDGDNWEALRPRRGRAVAPPADARAPADVHHSRHRLRYAAAAARLAAGGHQYHGGG